MIKLVSLEKTCIGCPSQWVGETDDGKNFYARYRWGNLRARLDGVAFYDNQISHEHDGLMDTDQMVELLEIDLEQKLIDKNLINWKEAIANMQKFIDWFKDYKD